MAQESATDGVGMSGHVDREGWMWTRTGSNTWIRRKDGQVEEVEFTVVSTGRRKRMGFVHRPVTEATGAPK